MISIIVKCIFFSFLQSKIHTVSGAAPFEYTSHDMNRIGIRAK